MNPWHTRGYPGSHTFTGRFDPAGFVASIRLQGCAIWGSTITHATSWVAAQAEQR